MVNTVEFPPCSVIEVAACFKATVNMAHRRSYGQVFTSPVTCALVEPTLTNVPVCVLNTSEKPVTFHAGKVVTTLQQVEHPIQGVVAIEGYGTETEVEDEKQQIIRDLVEGCGSGLTPGEKEMFYNLLVTYADVMAHSTSDLGRMNELSITLAWEMHHQYGGLFPASRFIAKVCQLLSQMLERGVVKPSSSLWASPVSFVQTKGQHHKILNQVMHKDAYGHNPGYPSGITMVYHP